MKYSQNITYLGVLQRNGVLQSKSHVYRCITVKRCITGQTVYLQSKSHEDDVNQIRMDVNFKKHEKTHMGLT